MWSTNRPTYQIIQPINGDPFIGSLETPVTSSFVNCLVPVQWTAVGPLLQGVEVAERTASSGVPFHLGRPTGRHSGHSPDPSSRRPCSDAEHLPAYVWDCIRAINFKDDCDV